MELGLDFDDGDFSDKVTGEKQTLTSYNAKVCYNQWFLSEKADNGKNDPATLNKFRADYHYYRGHYNTALEFYKQALGGLGSQNKTMRREIHESMIRCCIQTGHFQQANDAMQTLISDCVTVDHYIQALLLKQKLYHCAGYLKDEIHVLQQLILLHPLNSPLWVSLADAYTRLQSGRKAAVQLCTPCTIPEDIHAGSPTHKPPAETIDTIANNTCTTECNSLYVSENTHNSVKSKERHNNAGDMNASSETTESSSRDIEIGVKESLCIESSNGRSHGDVNQAETSDRLGDRPSMDGHKVEVDLGGFDLGGFDLDLMLLTCYVRIRLILETTHATVTSFIKQHNIKLSSKVNEQIKALHATKEYIDAVDQFMRTDMFEDDREDCAGSDEQVCDAKTLGECGSKNDEFNAKWFTWMRDITTTSTQ